MNTFMRRSRTKRSLELEDLPDGNRSHGKLQKRRSRSKFTRISKGARRDREPHRDYRGRKL